MDIEKRLGELQQRLAYITDLFSSKEPENVALLARKLGEFEARHPIGATSENIKLLAQIEDIFSFVENSVESRLTAMDMVRIVRHPQRITLMDILENVYDSYTEIGGMDELSLDPAMLIARAYITRRQGDKVHNHPVMVIGQEKGHGQDFRNGGSVKPWGNAKALQYMKVAETENIPIHTYVFTPGAFPLEDYPGAAQQIARNLYEMAGIRVPIISVFSEGGSGGAEAIAMADTRLMLSHGYYSVISPEGGAAIESGIRQGQRAPVEMIESCAESLGITAADNLKNGYIDRIIQEPPLGARPGHYDFFRKLRAEVIRATDEVFLGVKGVKLFRALALHRRKTDAAVSPESMFVRWSLDPSDGDTLLHRRHVRFRKMSSKAYIEPVSTVGKAMSTAQTMAWSGWSYLRYDLVGSHLKKLGRMAEEMSAEVGVVTGKLFGRGASAANGTRAIAPVAEKINMLTELSCPEEGVCLTDWGSTGYVSQKATEDRAVTCPMSASYGCPDMWAPDLYGDFAGVCATCGHHFPMEYEWYLANLFEKGSINEFGQEIESTNPLNYPGFDEKLAAAKKKTGRKSSCITFEATIDGIKVVVANLIAPFRGGTVGAAEGEKFIRAAARARKKHYPFLAYVHGTAGIRIQEGVNGVIQMPRATMAVRRYIEAGGLYLVLYDTNSYAGPVASFLGCSPYQFAIRSSNIGFAGPGVIKETTGLDIAPDYQQAHQALARGHIQGIWDRREARKNLVQAFQTIGGRNLYYR